MAKIQKYKVRVEIADGVFVALEVESNNKKKVESFMKSMNAIKAGAKFEVGKEGDSGGLLGGLL